MTTFLCTVQGETILFDVHVQPRASQSEIVGLYGTALKVRLHAPPVDGKANAALVAFLADQLGLKAHQVTIVSGQTARHKRIAVTGITVARLKEKLHIDS